LPVDVHPIVEGKKLEFWAGGTAVSPGELQGCGPLLYRDDDSNPARLESYIMHYLTPETRSTSHYWWSISNDYAQ